METIEAMEIISSGPLTTVQDLGRFGFGQYGVAPSGALDSLSMRIANILVDNPEGEACLEVTLMGLKVRALTDLVIAVTGADLQPLKDERPFKMWYSNSFDKGQTLSFQGPINGFRAYLSIGGGISLPPVLGSKSTNLGSGFGGLNGRSLKRGDILSSNSPHLHLRAEGKALDRELIPTYKKNWSLRVLFGPQDDHFTETARKTFLDSLFNVTPHSDRTGLRLAGPAIRTKTGMEESIISEGVIAGAIQVPGDGRPIIILVETVTGGYRKIATVISADLHLLGQVKPGDSINFQEVSMDEAYEAFRDMEGMIKKFRERCICSINTGQ
ncbi:MAG TPA: KipI antagonist [Desulfobacteraceae bacterium]|nr:KipI antagonist [Desulfobacteraceae bacterium]